MHWLPNNMVQYILWFTGEPKFGVENYSMQCLWWPKTAGYSALVAQKHWALRLSVECSASAEEYVAVRLQATVHSWKYCALLACSGSSEEYGAVRLHWWRTGLVRRSVWCRCWSRCQWGGAPLTGWFLKLASFSGVFDRVKICSKIPFFKKWKM